MPGTLVARRQLVLGVFVAMEGVEKLLHVPVHPALAHLVRVDLDERVVPALGLHGQLERTERAGVGAGLGRGRVLVRELFADLS